MKKHNGKPCNICRILADTEPQKRPSNITECQKYLMISYFFNSKMCFLHFITSKIRIELRINKRSFNYIFFFHRIHKIICLTIEDILDLMKYEISSKSHKSENNRLNGSDKFMND